VPNWQQHVRERLGALGIAPQLEEEVVVELAGHLEDRRTSAVNNGMTEPEAIAMALEEVPDWVALNQEVSAAKKENPMSVHTKNLVLPGVTMLIGAAILLLALVRLVPPITWVEPKAPVVIFVLWLLSYGVMGALGAYWSRREGGNTATRFLAGVFPLAMHLGIFLCVIFATVVSVARNPEHHLSGFLARAVLSFVVAPGVALAIGTLPFLRDRFSTGPVPVTGSR